MLDDATLDRLLADTNPEPDPLDETDAAWARLLASEDRRRALPGRQVLIPALAACAAACAFAVLNWLPSTEPGSLSAAYAKAITHGEQVLGAGTGRVLYVEIATTSKDSHRTTHFLDRSWQGYNASRYYDSASGPGTSNSVTDVSQLGGVAAYYVPATKTLHVDHQLADRPQRFEQTGNDPTDTALRAVLNAKANHGSAHASSAPGALRDLSRLPGARTTHRHGLVTITVTNGRFYTQAIAHSGNLQPISITITQPDFFRKSAEETTRMRFTHYEYLPAAIGARQIDLLDMYPHAKVVSPHGK